MIVPKELRFYKERWRYIKGYEGIYAVSDFGRVWSCPRTKTVRTKWGTPGTRFIAGSFRAPGSVGKGYQQMTLFSEKCKRTRHGLHRLVAEAFVPKTNDAYDVVMHSDDDPTNNYFKNLTWGTVQLNEDDKCAKLRQARGETQGSSKLTVAQVKRIRKLAALGTTHRALATMYAIGKTTVTKIVSHSLWNHVI